MEWREGGRGGEGDAFPGQLTYHHAQFWRPVGDACRGERRHSLFKSSVLRGYTCLVTFGTTNCLPD